MNRNPTQHTIAILAASAATILAVFAASCSDAPSKTGDSSNETPNGATNGGVTADLLTYCEENAGEYVCSRANGFKISMTVEPSCGSFGEFQQQCDVTVGLVESCRQVIDECPQTGAPEDHFAEPCGDWFYCVINHETNNLPTNDGTTNNTAANDDANADVYSLEFLAVVDILRENCLLGGCHGDPPGAAQVFFVPTGQTATPGEIEDVLTSSTTVDGEMLIVPNEPDSSPLYTEIVENDSGVQSHTLSEESLRTLRAWIANGAQYRP